MTDFTKRAKELENENNFEGALNYYEMAIEEKSGPFDIRSDMGRVLNKMKRYDESIDCFDMVLMMRENHLNSLFGKGIANLGLNNWKEALDYFLKANKLDVNNPNFWYYSSIILRELNDEENSEIAYGKFLELDDENFKKERSYYDFGLLFNEREVELKKGDKHFNIDGYTALLSSYNLTEGEILSYLRATPLDELENKISILNQENSKNQELKIIYDEFNKMGLDNDDIRQLLEIETIESLKEDIKSRTKTDPFIISEEMPEIQLYDTFKSMPVNFAYNYRISDEIEIIRKKEEGILNKIIGMISNGHHKEKNVQGRNKIQKDLKTLNELIYKGEKKLAIEKYKDIKNSKVRNFDDLYLKYNLYIVLLRYYIKKDVEGAISDFNKILKFDKWNKFEKNSVIFYHLANIYYDLGFYEDSIKYYNKYLRLSNSKYNRAYDHVCYLKSSAYYRKSDFKKAFEEYDKISEKNKNQTVLKHIFQKINEKELGKL